jgi:hypothetical protein
MKTEASRITKQGFTLVEVALAVLAVGLGLVTVFGLFPAGLQNASDDAADTRAGLFAGAVFSGMRGASIAVTNVSTWDTKDTDFIGSSMEVEGATVTFNGASHSVKFPNAAADEPDNYLRYIISIEVAKAGTPKTYSATLAMCDGRYGAFTTQNVFYTEFYYTGM